MLDFLIKKFYDGLEVNKNEIDKLQEEFEHSIEINPDFDENDYKLVMYLKNNGVEKEGFIDDINEYFNEQSTNVKE